MKALLTGNRRYRIAILLFMILIPRQGFFTQAALPEEAGAASAQWNSDFAGGWALYGKLSSREAGLLLDKMYEKAQADRNSLEWIRCLVCKAVRLNSNSLDAIRMLEKESWPQGVMESSIMNLFYTRSLVGFARNHSQAIDQRKTTDSASADGPEAWTRERFQAESLKALEKVWRNIARMEDIAQGPWKEFFIPNTYPEGIRPTSRDAVSYLMVRMMGDATIWSSGQINGIFNLNLKSLAGDIGKPTSIADPQIHPLAKICFVLSNLEQWHRKKGNREAALEARLERYRLLHHYFKKASDRVHLQGSLEKYLKALAGDPWWSEGMAQLARFVLTEDGSGLISWERYLSSEIDRNFAYGADPEKLARALRIAVKGNEAFPDSIGGKHCLAILKAIQDSDYSIRAMRNDGVRQKSILATHRNLDKLYFRAYEIDLLKTIEKYCDTELAESANYDEERRSFIIGSYSDDLLDGDMEAVVAEKKPDHEWEVSLPPTPDNRMHKTFILPPMIRPGAFLIIASARPDFSDYDSYNGPPRRLFLTISDLALISRRLGNSYEVTILRGSSGRPAAGVEVRFYGFDYDKRRSYMDLKISDKSGRAVFHGEKGKVGYFLAARADSDSAYDSQRLYYHQPEKPPEYDVLSFLDKTIHRPKEKLVWKAVLYQKTRGFNYRTCPGIAFTVSLKSGNRHILESKTVTSNSFGTASGEFAIPAAPVPENLFLEAPGSPMFPVTVKELKQPMFDAIILDPKKPFRMNLPVRIQGTAKYRSGLPVKKGRVRWTARRSNDSSMSWTIAQGEAPLRENSAFSFVFLPEADKEANLNKDIPHTFTVDVDVTDENGGTRSAQRSFRAGSASVYAEVLRDNEFFLENNPVRLTIRRTGINGALRKGRGRWKIVRLSQPSNTLLPAEQPTQPPGGFETEKGFRTPGDLETARWEYDYNPDAEMMQWTDESTQASGSASHDDKGEAAISVPGLPSGAYRLIYETSDSFGAKFGLRENFLVASPAMSLRLPAMLALEKPVVKAGGAARILAHSGIQDQFMILEIFRGWECILRQEMISRKGPVLIEFPIVEEDRGGLNVALTLVRDHQFIRLQKPIAVPHDDKRLKIELVKFRDRLRTGGREKWSVKVAGPEGENAAIPETELLAYMYDRNWDSIMPRFPWGPIHAYPWISPKILAIPNLGEAVEVLGRSQSYFRRKPDVPSLKSDRLIAGYPPPSRQLSDALDRDVATMDYFLKTYPEVASASGIGQDGVFVEHPLNRSGFYGRNYPEGRSYSDSFSPIYQEGPKVAASQNFRETAFWKPHLVADDSGAVSFEFDVPDSATSWNVFIHAITRDLRYGAVHRVVRSSR